MSHWDTGPAKQVGAQEDYPRPAPGPVTTWRLRTPGGEQVGTLTFNDGGVAWTFASGVGLDAQEHGAEVLAYLRRNAAQSTPLADTLAGIRTAYAGDLDES